MNNRTEIASEKEHIASFLRSLPDADITISGKAQTNELFINGKKINLQKSLKVRNHSPTGFNWGYDGSGPAQSALGILMEFVDKVDAATFYQDLKFGFINRFEVGKDFSVVVNLRQKMAEILFK